MSKLVFCGSCKYLKWAGGSACTHPSVVKIENDFDEPTKSYGNCRERNGDNDCSDYKWSFVRAHPIALIITGVFLFFFVLLPLICFVSVRTANSEMASTLALPNAFTRPGFDTLVGISEFLNQEVKRPEIATIEILDIGAGRMKFARPIQDFMNVAMLGKTINVTMIDDGSIFGEDSFRSGHAEEIYDMWFKEVERQGIKFYFTDLADLHKKTDQRYDFIFLSAPYDMRGQISWLVRGAVRYMREDSLLFVRLYEHDQNAHFESQIKGAVETEGLSMMEVKTDMPEGTYPLSQHTYVIKRTKFIGQGEAFGKSLGDFAKVIFNEKELKRSA